MLLSLCLYMSAYTKYSENAILESVAQVRECRDRAEVRLLANQNDRKVVEFVQRLYAADPWVQIEYYADDAPHAELFWRLGRKATGRWVWFIEEGMAAAKGSVLYLIAVVEGITAGMNAKLIVVNSGAFSAGADSEGVGPNELANLKVTASLIELPAGWELLSRFTLDELVRPSLLLMERASWLATSYRDAQAEVQDPHLVSAMELCTRGMVIFFPRVCVMRLSDVFLARGTKRSAVFHLCELPHLYKKAVAKGFNSSRATKEVVRVFKARRDECALLFADPSGNAAEIASMKANHMAYGHFLTTILPFMLRSKSNGGREALRRIASGKP
ncbi:MAG: hypothetical protein SF028_14275 [Candidatus Sumerlaeia bacterium]|nr:hypothetical protein [Candidatus Sumerlaeia bacterium]